MSPSLQDRLKQKRKILDKEEDRTNLKNMGITVLIILGAVAVIFTIMNMEFRYQESADAGGDQPQFEQSP